MSRHTRRSLSLPARMAAAGVDRVFVAEATTLALGYGSQRLTNSRLWSDNMALRTRAEQAEAERDEWQEEVARCTLSCPPGFRKSPASDGVKALRAERDRLRAALDEIATAASGIAHDLQIGPEDEGRDIYDMALAIRDDARAALKGTSE